MKTFVGLFLSLCLALPACSAEDKTTTATEAPAVTEQASTNPPAARPAPVTQSDENPAPVNEPADIVVAQAPQTERTEPVAAPQQRNDIVAGRHYRVLTPAQPTSSSPDKVEVAEVFMYSCPHCMDFEPFIESYLASAPPYVSFIRIPASFNSTARLHTKAYYMAETLGILEDVHGDFFDEYHKKRNRLGNEKAISAFFVKHGVEKDEVESAFNSFAVDTKVRQADNLGRRYGIDSVPSLVINGKYVTSGSMTGSTTKLREVVNYLVAKEASQL
ncbi:MAG: DsbA family protein [Gammaproteobacteria bacterium]|nr:DsbA family protein [Gammaproteobacteria bacterium]